MLLPGVLVGNKGLDVLAVHVLGHVIRLPFLERETKRKRKSDSDQIPKTRVFTEKKAYKSNEGKDLPQAFMRIILVIRLVLVVLDLDEIAVHGRRIQTQAHDRVDRRGLGDQLEGPALLVLELDEILVVLGDLVPLVFEALNSFGSANHWPAILYRSFA